MHCSLLATDMFVWTDIEHLLWRLQAVDTSPILNACIHLATVSYGRVWSTTASCSSAWYSCAFLRQRTDFFIYEHCYTLQTVISEQGSQNNDVWTWNVYAVLYIYPHMMIAFTSTFHMLSDEFTAFPMSHFWPKKSLSCLTEWLSY